MIYPYIHSSFYLEWAISPFQRLDLDVAQFISYLGCAFLRNLEHLSNVTLQFFCFTFPLGVTLIH